MLDSKRKNTRILLAEDNITNQLVTLAVLENMGLSADAVNNGQEAINALESAPYDLVLMDCHMPLLDGYEATRRIRNVQSRVLNHQVPVVAMTAHASLSERERCLQCGMDDFLSKPVIPQMLVEKLEKWLSDPPPFPQRILDAYHLEPSMAHHWKVLPVWDREGMLARLMGDTQVAKTIGRGFLADVPLQIKELKTSLSAGDAAGVVRQAHTIKGAAAIIGGERLKAVAREIEQSAQTGPLGALHAHLDAMRTEFEVLKQQMQQVFPAGDEK
ncbi:MAG: response regulator [Desulfobulbus sp.]